MDSLKENINLRVSAMDLFTYPCTVFMTSQSPPLILSPAVKPTRKSEEYHFRIAEDHGGKVLVDQVHKCLTLATNVENTIGKSTVS
jgi:hypothetical protein